MKTKIVLLLFFYITLISNLTGQEKRDYQWILGGSSDRDGIVMNFNFSPVSISYQRKKMKMEGSNTSMCDAEGNLLFYSNGCFMANAAHETMQNGGGINPGLIQDLYCPVGGNPLPQTVISLPAPGSDSLYYVFNLDLDDPYFLTQFFGVAPERLFYQLIDITQDSGLGEVVLKNQVAVQDTFARGTLQAVRHANGQDWWVVVPKSHTNCYFLVRITAEGIQPAVLECGGLVWNDSDAGQAVFSPAATKYIRFNYQNGLNILDFDNETGLFSNPVTIGFPNDTFPTTAGVAVSPNSRYLYATARTRVYQFDLEAPDIEASKIVVAEYDGFVNPYPTIFNLAALAPDGKIYIASTSSTLNLHVIHKPDCPGLMCELEQHGIDLPSYNFVSIPNFPHYRNQPTGIDCDSVIISSYDIENSLVIRAFPNPSSGSLAVEIEGFKKSLDLELYDLLGRQVLSQVLREELNIIETRNLQPGGYFYFVKEQGAVIKQGKLVLL